MSEAKKVLVGILMGSDSDWPVMKLAVEALAEFGVGSEARVMSAHRTPEDVAEYARGADGRGLRVMIAGAGGAAHLAGVVAAWTVLPVIGVPIESGSLRGLDSLLSIVQMPAGVPVGSGGDRGGAECGVVGGADVGGWGDDGAAGEVCGVQGAAGGGVAGEGWEIAGGLIFLGRGGEAGVCWRLQGKMFFERNETGRCLILCRVEIDTWVPVNIHNGGCASPSLTWPHPGHHR